MIKRFVPLFYGFLWIMFLPGNSQNTFLSKAPGSAWEPIGPPGGNIVAIVSNPQNNADLYAATSEYPAKIYRSTNGSQSWEKISAINDRVYDLALNQLNQSILFALSSSGVYRSMNGGANWSYVNFGSGNYCDRGKIGINQVDSNIIYACGYRYESGAYYMAIFKSINGGDSWAATKISQGASYASVYGLAVFPSNPNLVYACGYYYSSTNSPFSESAGYSYKVYRTTNGGSSWQDISGPINGYPYSLVIDPLNSSRVFVGTGFGVYRSSDGGANWSQNNGYAYSYALAMDPANPNILYSGYSGACYKSTDGGINWTSYTSGLAGTCNTLLVSQAGTGALFYGGAEGTVFFGSGAGIFRSADGGVSWQERNSGISATNVTSVAISRSSPNILFAEASGNGFFRSWDSGTTWERCPYSYRCESVQKIAVNPNNPNDLFILAGG